MWAGKRANTMPVAVVRLRSMVRSSAAQPSGDPNHNSGSHLRTPQRSSLSENRIRLPGVRICRSGTTPLSRLGDSAEVFSMSNVVSFDRQAREQFRQIAQQRRIAEHAVDNAKAQLHRWRRWSSTAATDSACLSTNCPHRYTDSTIRHYLASRSESAAPRGLRRETRVSKG
jgi:hypothetical protein